MKVYRVGIARRVGQDDVELADEYFPSEQKARARRKALIAADPDLRASAYREDYEVEQITMAGLPRAKLVLAILNDQDWVAERVAILPPYQPSTDDVGDPAGRP